MDICILFFIVARMILVLGFRIKREVYVEFNRVLRNNFERVVRVYRKDL